MVKTVIKVDGMSCGMCESHMNDLVRSLFQVKKVTSSAKDGETVVLSDEILDIPYLKMKMKMKGIGYKLVSVESTHED